MNVSETSLISFRYHIVILQASSTFYLVMTSLSKDGNPETVLLLKICILFLRKSHSNFFQSVPVVSSKHSIPERIFIPHFCSLNNSRFQNLALPYEIHVSAVKSQSCHVVYSSSPTKASSPSLPRSSENRPLRLTSAAPILSRTAVISMAACRDEGSLPSCLSQPLPRSGFSSLLSSLYPLLSSLLSLLSPL